MVEYDSVIPAGQAGKITMKINLRGFREGQFQKSVTVASNAKNKNTLRLSVRGNIKPIISISKRFIRMAVDNNEHIKGELDFRTEMPKFEIEEIIYQSLSQNPIKKTDWQSEINSFTAEFTLTNSDTTDQHGYYSYHLGFSFDAFLDLPRNGKLIFKTNHPKRKDIVIRAMVMARRKDN